MKKHSLSVSVLVTVLGVGLLAGTVFGCKSSDAAAPRVSRKGEACQTTNDCAAALSCVPLTNGTGGICVTGEFHVAPTAKECAVIECAVPSDCCPTPASNCTQLAQQCAQFGDAGTGDFYCEEYKRLCKCDGSKFSCTNGSCKSQCSTDADCFGAKCTSGKCVQCTDNAQCAGISGTTCVNNSCQGPCTTDSDCPSFNRCTSGACVESGCLTDRECVAATKNVEATCVADKCVVPCQTDLECGNPKSYSFHSCINSQCVYVGCDSDKDCELYLNGGSDAGNGGSKSHIVCRAAVAK